MMNYQYVVTAHYEDAELVCKTNNFDTCMTFLVKHSNEGVWCDVVDGYTGEVLAVQNHEQPYSQSDFTFAMLDWLMAHNTAVLARLKEGE